MSSYEQGGPGGATATYVKSAVPRHGFAPPPKGYFAAPGSTPAFSGGVGVSISSARSPLLGPGAAANPLGSPSALDELAPASAPSSVPTKGRRRESIGGQMRRKVSESTAAAAGAGGGLGHGSAFSLASRMNIPARGGPGGMGGGSEAFSTSLGAAGEALSLSSSLSTPGMPLLGRTPSAYGASVPNGGGAAHVKQERTASHTHFGQECYGPTPGETPLAPPAALLSPGSRGAAPPAYARRPSAADSTATDDDMSVVGEANAKSAPAQQPTSQQSHQQLHKCESCAKVYRHPSCLVKHRWEHTVYWKEASKFLMSKHQQVQLLEAAAILVGMDCHARSLPEEKALWPAAVSPPSSGLLGSDKLNFDQLLAQKAARKAESPSPFAERHLAPSSLGAPRSAGRAHSNSNASATLSPLNALTSLNIGGPRAGAARTPASSGVGANGTSAARANGDVQPLRLDESAERTRDDADDDDEEEADSPPMAEREAGEDGLGAGIEMEMEGVE